MHVRPKTQTADASRRAARTEGKGATAKKKSVDARDGSEEAAAAGVADTFERNDDARDARDRQQQQQQQQQPPKQTWWQRVTHPQISTKKAAHASSVFIAGVEIAVKVNHVDPLNDGRRDVKGNWVADGENLAVDLESIFLRRNLPRGMRLELQGPALQAKADGEALPLRARFVGVGVTKDVSGDMPHDDTPPRAEVKIEVKLTDKSIGSLAGLAGAAGELKGYLTELEASEGARVVGDVLLAAVPVISTGVALLSVKRALKALRDAAAPLTTKALAVARAIADTTTIFLPLIGTMLNLALVGAAVAVARREAMHVNDDAQTPAPAPAPTPETTRSGA